MAHEIEAKDVFGEVRARGERAWHGLGVEIPDGLGTWEAFEKIGLDWETELCPLTTVVETSEGTKRLPVPESMAHIRKDTLDVLGVVGAGYRPISNRELAEFADALVGADAAVTVETAGSLRSGRRIFALVRLPKNIEVTDEDVLQQYVLLSNSHDGSSAFQCYPTSIRVVCANTLRWSEKDAVKGVRFQHTGAIDQKIHAARAALGIVLRSNEEFEKQVRLLAKKSLKKKDIEDYFKTTYHHTFEWVDEQKAQKDESEEKKLLKRDYVLDQWWRSLEHRNQQLPKIRGTAWAAFNAVGQWHEHERGRFGAVHESDGRVHSNLFGVSHLHKRIAYNLALQLL